MAGLWELGMFCSIQPARKWGAHKDLSSARNPSEQERDSPLQDLEDSSLELEQGLQKEDNLLTPPSVLPETWLGLPIYRARRQCIWAVWTAGLVLLWDGRNRKLTQPS